MATSFPSGLDALTNPTSGDTLASPSHSAQHANANDAIEALEAKVGVDGSAVTTSHDYKIATINNNYVHSVTGGTGVTVTGGTGSASTPSVAIGQAVGTGNSVTFASVTSSGDFFASSGAAATPSHTFTGDTNTGMWRPGADTIAFSTGGSEQVRIYSTGQVGIGFSAAPGCDLTVLGSPNISNACCIGTQATSSRVGLGVGGDSTATRNHIKFYNPNGNVGTISTNGTTTTYATSSDYRLKENVTAVDNPVGRLQSIQVHDFNFVADPTVRVTGFIAHELAEIIPEAVTGEKDAMNDDGSIAPQGVDQSKVVPLLVAALQDALARIAVLEAKLAQS